MSSLATISSAIAEGLRDTLLSVEIMLAAAAQHCTDKYICSRPYGIRTTMPLTPNRQSRCIQICTLSVGNRHRLNTARAIYTPRRQVLSTLNRPLSLFISHSPTVREPWRNFLSLEFGTEFQREVSSFLDTLISIT